MLFYWSTCVNSSPSLLRSTWKKSSLLSPVVSLKSSRRQKKRSSCHQTPYNKNPTRFSSGRKHLRKYILSVYYSPSSLLQTAPTEAYVFLVCWYVCVILCCGKPWLLLLNILTDWHSSCSSQPQQKLLSFKPEKNMKQKFVWVLILHDF